MNTAKAVGLGGLIAGSLDLLDAWIFFGLRGVPPISILHSIASGVLGRAAHQGGLRTATLGLALHFFIASVVAAVFIVASRRYPTLTARPFRWGAIYGVAVFFIMRDVVLPLAGVPSGRFSWPVFTNGMLIHVLGVGIPIALVARHWRPVTGSPR
jgi:uncharacterized membrane protein YagU involved in acid resistance